MKCCPKISRHSKPRVRMGKSCQCTSGLKFQHIYPVHSLVVSLYWSHQVWKNIFITHLIIIFKSEVSTFPIVVIFFRGCVSEMVVLSYSVIHYIYIPGALGPCFHYWCSVYGSCKLSDTLCLWVMFVCLQTTPSHYYHYADLSEGIELLKCLSGVCCRVCV